MFLPLAFATRKHPKRLIHYATLESDMWHHGVSPSRSQPLLWLKSCLTWSAHCGRKPDTLGSSVDVDYRLLDICASSPLKCLESWCSVGDGGSPVTTLYSLACLSFLSACCGKSFTLITVDDPLRLNHVNTVCLVLFLIAGGSAPWFCLPTTRVVLTVAG